MIAVSYALLAQAAQQRPALRSATEAPVQNTAPRRQLAAQPKNRWHGDESACMISVYEDAKMTEIKVRRAKGKYSLMTKLECERACRAKHGATACQWYNHFERVYIGGGYGDLGECSYTTESRPLYDCGHVPIDDYYLEEMNQSVCLEDYDGSADYCMIFDKPVNNPKTTCTGADFQKKLKEVNQKGAKFFGCGKSKTKKNCQWGCKKGYTLRNGFKKKVVKAGTKSGYFATCVDGRVIHTYLPLCQK